jgi:HD-GYP domain-containing protein (c-di-GMP phosphodiesterase class II)
MEAPRPSPPQPAAEPAPVVSPLGQPKDLNYELAIQEIQRILEAAQDERSFSIGSLQRIVAGMARAFSAGDDRLVVQAMEVDEGEFGLARHMVNTAIFAMKIAQGLEIPEEELPWAGLAAALHDVGMVIVPQRTLGKAANLSSEEMAIVRQHPEKGFRILQGLGPEYEWLANVALQEHEREDGSGYPRGLKGDEIHELAKVVGLADVYEAITHPRPYRTARAPLDIVKEIIATERTKFSDRVLKGFIRGLSTFPVGSFVRLNSNEIARVVATNPVLPLRPVVDVVAGPKGEPLDSPRRIDLSSSTLIYITGPSPSLPPAHGDRK